MNTLKLDRILEGKREQYPALNGPLTWGVFLRILKDEGILWRVGKLPRPAQLLQFDGVWTIVVNSAIAPSRWMAHGVHELAHLWAHVDVAQGRYEPVMNYSYPENTDPREEEADYIANALLFGPRMFSAIVKGYRISERKRPDLFPRVVAGFGTFEVRVVGTAFHQQSLASICGDRRPDGHLVKVMAVLKCEDTNHHDPQAVRVEIAGIRIGYLSRANARLFRRQFSRQEIHCDARISGGWDRGGNEAGHFGVRLDLRLEVAV